MAHHMLMVMEPDERMNERAAAAARLDTVFGPALVWVDADGALTKLHFLRPEEVSEVEGAGPDNAAVARVARELAEYGAGTRRDFTLKLAPKGSPFQQAVWQALCDIPYGETQSYGHLATRIGHPGKARAVGAANGANPIALVIPCHRVIGADGSLTGYGGGLPLKMRMLDFERAHAGDRVGVQRSLFG